MKNITNPPNNLSPYLTLNEAKDVLLEIPIEFSVSQLNALLDDADELAKQKDSTIYIDGLKQLYTSLSLSDRKEIIPCLGRLTSPFKFKDEFHLTQEKIKGYLEVINTLEVFNRSEKYPYFNLPKSGLSDEERKKRARNARTQRADFDSNNVKARRRVILAKADGVPVKDLLAEFEKEGITSSRGNAYSPTAVTRLWSDFFTVRERFYSPNFFSSQRKGNEVLMQQASNNRPDDLLMGIKSPDKGDYEIVGEQISDQQTEGVGTSRIPKESPFLLNYLSMLENDKRVHAERKLILPFVKYPSSPLYLTFNNGSEIVDSLVIKPSDIKDYKLTLDILKDTVLVPGDYWVNVSTSDPNSDVEADPKDAHPGFVLRLGFSFIKLPKEIIILFNEKTKKYRVVRIPDESLL